MSDCRHAAPPVASAAREATAPPYHGTHRADCPGWGPWWHTCDRETLARALADATTPAAIATAEAALTRLQDAEDASYCRMHDLYDCPYAHG